MVDISEWILDRIDSTKGYIVGNIQWIHKAVNKMKMEFSVADFMAVCKVVADCRSKPHSGK